MKYNSKILSLMITLIFAFSLVLVSTIATYAVDPNGNGMFGSTTIDGDKPAGNGQMSTSNQDNNGNKGNTGGQSNNGGNSNKGGGTSEVPGVTEKLNEINTILFTLACIVCVIKAVQIGIMFMLNGAGGKGQAKSAILPWIIGAVVCGGYSVIADKVTGLIQGDDDEVGGVLDPGDASDVVNSLGGTILSMVMYVAYATAFGVIFIIAIKYMTGAAGDKAKIKATFLPYLIGAIIVGASSQIAIEVMSWVAGKG